LGTIHLSRAIKRNALRKCHIGIISNGFCAWVGTFGMTLRKTLRILGISLALVALLVFATGVVSDWHHHDSTTDAHCPYCHLGHQAPIQAESPLCITVLKPLASLPLAEDMVPPAGPVFSQTAPRAPPIA
jgi:hypothetical protein